MNKYSINYSLALANGKVIDKGDNFTLEVGIGVFASAFEELIMQAKINKLQTILMSGAEVFGEINEDSKQIMQKSKLPYNIQINNAIEFKTPNNESVVGIVRKITKNDALVDFNHPLANSNIAFTFKVLCKK